MIPFVVLYLLRFQRSTPQGGKDAVGPIVRRHIQSTEHLRSRDGFRIHTHFTMRCPTFRHCLHQHAEEERYRHVSSSVRLLPDAFRFSSTTGPQCHHAVTHTLCFVELNQFQNPRRVMNELRLFGLEEFAQGTRDGVVPVEAHLSSNGCFNFWIAFGLQLNTRKQIIDQRHEQRFVFIDLRRRKASSWLIASFVWTNQFRQIHITQDSHHCFLLGIRGILTFERAQCTQDGQNISQAEIVVNLFGQLFFAQFVERVELLR